MDNNETKILFSEIVNKINDPLARMKKSNDTLKQMRGKRISLPNLYKLKLQGNIINKFIPDNLNKVEKLLEICKLLELIKKMNRESE